MVPRDAYRVRHQLAAVGDQGDAEVRNNISLLRERYVSNWKDMKCSPPSPTPTATVDVGYNTTVSPGEMRNILLYCITDYGNNNHNRADVLTIDLYCSCYPRLISSSQSRSAVDCGLSIHPSSTILPSFLPSSLSSINQSISPAILSFA